MANGIVAAVPPALGPWFAVITGVLSMPLTFFLTNDAFYFGILPILTEAAGHYGIAPVEMARASIIGQPVHMTSPLVPALLLLVSLARVNLADHHKKVIWRSVVCSLVMLATAVGSGSSRSAESDRMDGVGRRAGIARTRCCWPSFSRVPGAGRVRRRPAAYRAAGHGPEQPGQRLRRHRPLGRPRDGAGRAGPQRRGVQPARAPAARSGCNGW